MAGEITRYLGFGTSQPSLIDEHETNEIPSQKSEVDSFLGVMLKVALWLPYAPAHICALYTSVTPPPKKKKKNSPPPPTKKQINFLFIMGFLAIGGGKFDFII